MDRIESVVARLAMSGLLISTTSTSQDEHASSCTDRMASSQTEQPAEKIIICLFSFIVIPQR